MLEGIDARTKTVMDVDQVVRENLNQSKFNALVISGTQTEKMDHFELLKITEGKNRKRSLVFYIVDHKNEKNY